MTIEDNLRLGAFLRSDKAGIQKDIQRAYDLFPILGERRRAGRGRPSPAANSKCSPWAGR